MSQIQFSKYVKLHNFNLTNQTDDINNSVQAPNLENENSIVNSVIYAYATNQMVDIVDGNLYLRAIYKPTSLSGNQFAIYRKSPQETHLTYLATISDVTDGVVDYNVKSNNQYKYIIQTNPQETHNISLETEYLNVCWNQWSLVSLNYDFHNNVYVPDDTVFFFKDNITAGSVSDNLNIIKYNTLGRFGKISQGNQRYDTGSLSCLLGDFGVVHRIDNNKIITIDDNNINIVSQLQTLILHEIPFPHSKQQYVFDIMGRALLVTINNKIIDDIYSEIRYDIIWNDEKHNIYYTSNGSDLSDGKRAFTIAIKNLINNMSQEYQRLLYCDFNYNQSKYYNTLLFLKTYNEYYNWGGLGWKKIVKKYQYCDDREKLQAWKQCVANGKIKLLKSPKGENWIVAISEQTSREIRYDTLSYPTVISFNWQEVMDQDTISIISW